MFTEKLPAWREKQRAKMALFQGKIQVEKSGGNLAHIRCVTPTTTPPTAQHNISHKQAISLQLQCFHEAWARFEKKVPTLGGTVGSAVGNPGEQGGEQGGKPRGARWGARWRNTERLTQHHRAGNLRWIRWNVSARIRHNHMRHIKVGRPGLPARPTSSAVCVRRQSLSLRLSQRRS